MSLRVWIEGELAALGVQDDAVLDYVAGMAAEEDANTDDVREAVEGFLSEATDAPLDSFLAALVERMRLDRAAARAHAEEAKRAAIVAAKASEAAALAVAPAAASASDADAAPRRELTAAERRQREALLAMYDNVGDDLVENEDGELEVVYRDHSADASADMSTVSRNRNGDVVADKEKQQRAKAKDEHARKVAREKELLERERERKEKAKQRTQKQERRK